MTFDGRAEGQFIVPTGGTTLSVTNGAGGPTAVTVAAGAYFLTAFLAALQAALIAQRPPSTGTWVVTLSTGASGTGKVTINCTQVAGTWSITWTDTTLRDLLGFTLNIVAVAVAQTGTKQARGLWIPDCPLNLDCDTARAPLVTDAISTVSPRGDVTTLEGNEMYRHTGMKWPLVSKAKVWEAAAAIVNASWETFWKDVHLGRGGLSWFTPGSKLQIYDHQSPSVQLGIDANGGAGVGGWVATKGPTSIEPKKHDGQWTGLWVIEIPELVSSG